MTELPRVMISMPPDIERAVNALKGQPENKRVPTSKLLCRLIRQGMENEELNEISKQAPPDSG